MQESERQYHEVANIDLSNMTVGQRAMLAAGWLIEDKKRRRQWMKQARSEFFPGNPQSCEICGKYQGVTQAHHIFPLYLQMACNLKSAIHDYSWLCPTHHEVAHKYIDALVKNLCYRPNGFDPQEIEAIDKFVANTFVPLYVKARFPHE